MLLAVLLRIRPRKRLPEDTVAEELEAGGEAHDIVIWSFVKPVDDGTGGDPAARLNAAKEQVDDIPDVKNDTGLPAARITPEARMVEQWCKYGSWAVCKRCHSVTRRALVMLATALRFVSRSSTPRRR